MGKCFFFRSCLVQIFQWLEQPYELKQSSELQKQLVEQREELIKMWKEAHEQRDYNHNLLEERMGAYEDVLQVRIDWQHSYSFFH